MWGKYREASMMFFIINEHKYPLLLLFEIKIKNKNILTRKKLSDYNGQHIFILFINE